MYWFSQNGYVCIQTQCCMDPSHFNHRLNSIVLHLFMNICFAQIIILQHMRILNRYLIILFVKHTFLNILAAFTQKLRKCRENGALFIETADKLLCFYTSVLLYLNIYNTKVIMYLYFILKSTTLCQPICMYYDC